MPQYPHKAGVYAIEFVATDRIYIGSSKNIPGRWYEHRLQLNRGTHHCPKLQNAWSKYGPDAFELRVLEEVPSDYTRESLLAREQFYLDALKPWFNVLPTAGSRLGSLDREETKRLKSAARRSVTELVTHCPKGHEYTPERTYLTKRNQRVCLECARLASIAKYVHKTPFRADGPVCEQGHEWTPENTHTLKNGTRQCKTCRAVRRQRRNEVNRERYANEPEFKAKRKAEFESHREARLASIRVYNAAHKAELSEYHRKRNEQERIAKGFPPEAGSTCRKGHPWTPENIIQETKRRLCRTCRDARRAAISPEQHAAELARRTERERAGWHDANQRAYARRKERLVAPKD